MKAIAGFTNLNDALSFQEGYTDKNSDIFWMVSVDTETFEVEMTMNTISEDKKAEVKASIDAYLAEHNTEHTLTYK